MTPERKRCGNHAGPDFTPCTRDADHTGPCAHALKEHPAPSMMLTPAMEAEIREHVAMRWTRHTWLGALLTLVDSLRSEVEALRGETGRLSVYGPHIDGAALQRDLAMAKIQADAAGSMLLSVQQDCIAEKRRADSLAGELATLRAAYEGLRKAANGALTAHTQVVRSIPRSATKDAYILQMIHLVKVVASQPASLAGKVRGRILREAATHVSHHPGCTATEASPQTCNVECEQLGLLSLAEEAERG